ncbi:MAG: stalk domain-containing protein [Bacillota bacterium]
MTLKTFFLRITLVLLLLSLCTPLYAWAVTDRDRADRAAQSACSYLLAKEKKDGPLMSWSYISLALAGEDLSKTMAEQAAREQEDLAFESGETNDYATLIFLLLATGGDPRNCRGHDLLEEIEDSQQPGGKYPDNVKQGGERLVNAHIWAVLALETACADASPEAEDKALQWLVSNQHTDGSFNWDAKSKDPDVDSTGMALMALGALGEDANSFAVKKAAAYLQNVQKESGGFESWGEENLESCGLAVNGLLSVGMDPLCPHWHKNNGDILDAILGYQLPDGGFSHTSGGRADEMATAQSVLALESIVHGSPFYAFMRNAFAKNDDAEERPEREVRFTVGRAGYSVRTGDNTRNETADAAPFVSGGRTYVPVRYLAAGIGVAAGDIVWDPGRNTVALSFEDTRVEMTVGDKRAAVNGETRLLDTPPLLKDGRVFLPARFVAEAFGYSVDWNASSQEVIIFK